MTQRVSSGLSDIAQDKCQAYMRSGMCAVENAVHSLRSRSEKLVTACLDNMEYLETLLRWRGSVRVGAVGAIAPENL